jgi:hypothetical protein
VAAGSGFLRPYTGNGSDTCIIASASSGGGGTWLWLVGSWLLSSFQSETRFNFANARSLVERLFVEFYYVTLAQATGSYSGSNLTLSLRIQISELHRHFTSILPSLSVSMKCKINFLQEQNLSEMRKKEKQIRSLSFLIIIYVLHLSGSETCAKLVEVCSKDIGWPIETWHTNKKPQKMHQLCANKKWLYFSPRSLHITYTYDADN